MVPIRDGVRLRADVFRPSSGGPHPVLVQRYPYSARDGYMAMFGQQIAAQGYAVVVQSCRGRFGSEGDFYPFHPDVDDSYDTVEWAAALPWSNGKVGMYGVSYSGMTQWTAAIARPPHLVCIAPSMCTWDWTVGGWYTSPGILTLGLALLWSAQMTAFEAERRGVEPPLPTFAEVARIMDEGGLGDLDGVGRVPGDAARRAYGHCWSAGRYETSRSCVRWLRGSATGAITTTPGTRTGGRSARQTTRRRSTCPSCTSPGGTTTSSRVVSTPTPPCPVAGATRRPRSSAWSPVPGTTTACRCAPTPTRASGCSSTSAQAPRRCGSSTTTSEVGSRTTTRNPRSAST